VTLRVWGRLTSVNVQKVVWCVEELGLPYERIEAGGKFGRNDTAEYLAMNPNGLVPVIEDEGFVLYESNAIVRYLCLRERSPLFPQELRPRADVDRWMEWQSTNFTPAMGPAFWQLVRTPAAQRDAAAVKTSCEKSEKLAGVLDAHLASRPWLAGDSFSAADIVAACAAHRWLHLPDITRQPRPHLERWYAACAARPASREVTSQVPIA
jgi:glutathione S-transferase